MFKQTNTKVIILQVAQSSYPQTTYKHWCVSAEKSYHPSIAFIHEM